MNTAQISTRRQRSEAAKQVTVSTHHNGNFGVWPWESLTEQEKAWYREAQKRNQHISLFGIYA